MEKKFIGGVFRTEEEAVNVIENLEKSGFTREDISIFAKGEDAEAIDDKTDVDVEGDDGDNKGKKAGKGVGIGAGTGAVLGGAAGLSLLAIPGAGPIMAAGPIAAAIEGGVIGAGGGGIVGALTGAGISKEDAERYEKYVEDGNIVIMVEASEDQQEGIYSTFRDHGTLNSDMYSKTDDTHKGGL